MKTPRQLTGLLALSLALSCAHAETTLPPGPAFIAPAGTTTYTLPADGRVTQGGLGVANYTTFTVPTGATVKFTRNALNTPVYIITTSTVDILGAIDVSGSAGTARSPGIGGPGGFDGGAPAIGVSPPGDGLGPGAGSGARPAATPPLAAGHAAYGTASTQGTASQNGQVYGTQLLMPLVGGSGGGGSTVGGGGGGGAILIKSDTLINISGTGFNGIVEAQGGSGGGVSGNGSGGAIRLVAPIIRGNGRLDVGPTLFGQGRIRCDLTDRSNFASIQHLPASAPFTSDQYLPLAFPPPGSPTLRIVSVGGMNVPANAPFTVVLPLNAPTDQPVVIEALGFGTSVPVRLKRTPVSGPALQPDIDFDIPNTSPTFTRTVPFPPNVPITLNVWTR